MNFKNDYERLAYYEAKMNYYGSKLNDVDGGVLGFGSSKPNLDTGKLKKAIEEYNTFAINVGNTDTNYNKLVKEVESTKNALVNAQVANTAAQKNLDEFMKMNPNIQMNITEKQRLKEAVHVLGGKV